MKYLPSEPNKCNANDKSISRSSPKYVVHNRCLNKLISVNSIRLVHRSKLNEKKYVERQLSVNIVANAPMT
ncbi:unnamed protein product [Schistosoma margrebowiei]|uniref:Uncharacterized protein n=1 Tax=Schistosoma margrebowiei TaxID=48269 RepID=A0A183MGQ7_9TREM|nr:unnamed protein product [Schistosoma margrebowiei]